MDFQTPESQQYPGQLGVADYNGVSYTETGKKGPSNMALYPAKLGQSLPSSATNYSVRYDTHGHPQKVLKLVNSEPFDDSKLRADEVSLKILSAPINHADVFQIEGQYGVQLPLPAIGGQEGVAVVEKVGKDVTSVAVGDWVIPYRAGYGGTWRQFAIANETNILKVPQDIPEEFAATISVNPSTALRILEDFEDLKPGDWIIQNAANGDVGMAIIQMARERGLHTINVVRADRPEWENAVCICEHAGGDINILDTRLNDAYFQEILKELPPIKLAINATGGNTVTEFSRILAANGTIVSYGKLSGQPVIIPQEHLVYKQLKVKGFWIADWYNKHTKTEASEMHEKIAQLVRDEQLASFMLLHDFDDFDWALKKQQESFTFRKSVLKMEYPDRLLQHDQEIPEDQYEDYEAQAGWGNTPTNSHLQ